MLTDSLMSPLFNLTRGSKQGDPLSPFVLFLELLATAIRLDTDIRGYGVEAMNITCFWMQTIFDYF